MVFIWTALSLVLPIAAGCLVVKRLWRGTTLDLRLALGATVGLAIAGTLFFAVLLLSDSARVSLAVTEGALCFLIAALWLTDRAPLELTLHKHSSNRLFFQAFSAIAVLAAASFLFASDLKRHGGWDAFVMWNMRGRLISTSTLSPMTTIMDPAFSGSHPDYPLLLPALVSRGWAYTDVALSSPVVPITIAAVFALATVVIAMSGVRTLSNDVHAWIAGSLLLSTPFLISTAAAQFADIVVSCFMTAAVVLFCVHDDDPHQTNRLALLAGIAAAAAACTKNEGILFLAILLAARIVRALGARGSDVSRREILQFIGGAAVGLSTLAFFKLVYSPPNDNLHVMSLQAALGRLKDIDLNRKVLRGFRDLAAFGSWSINPVPLMALHAAIVWRRPSVRIGRSWFTAAFVLLGMFCGYYCVYLLSSYDVESHVASSLDRLLLQLWPTLLILYCGIVAPRVSVPGRKVTSSGVLLRITAVLLATALTVLPQVNTSQRLGSIGPPHIELRPTEVTAGQSYSIKITGIAGPQVFVSYSIDGRPMGQFGAFLGTDGVVTFEVSASTPKGVYRFTAVQSAGDPTWTAFDGIVELTVK